jgi:protein gp37
MADNTHIEWTDATWNPVTGCSVVSPGCTNCYAMRLAGGRLRHVASRAGLTAPSKAGPVWNGQVRLNAADLTQPLRWKRPRRIFVCAHGDLFHEAVPDDWIDEVFAVMAIAQEHTFQVLTKRPERMRAYFARLAQYTADVGDDPALAARVLDEAAYAVTGAPCVSLEETPWPLPNVWLGVSVEDQVRADERIPLLLQTPAAVRFLSVEPLLGPIDLTNWTAIDWQCSHCRRFFTGRHRQICSACGRLGGWTGSHAFNGRHQPKRPVFPIDRGSGLDWIIVGGESGPAARPMHPDWARQIRDDCVAAGVSFFFKQWGEWAPGGEWPAELEREAGWAKRPDSQYRVGKRAAGRRLDGVTHDAMPARP